MLRVVTRRRRRHLGVDGKGCCRFENRFQLFRQPGLTALAGERDAANLDVQLRVGHTSPSGKTADDIPEVTFQLRLAGIRPHQRAYACVLLRKVEAPPGFEPGVEVLQCGCKVSQQAHFHGFTNKFYAIDVMAMNGLPSFSMVTTLPFPLPQIF
jgi:hypothetical protein